MKITEIYIATCVAGNTELILCKKGTVNYGVALTTT
jgi:hypothetical protein